MAKRSSTRWYRWFCRREFADIGSLLPAACPEGCGFAVLCQDAARGEIDASEFLVPVLGSNRFFAGSYSLPSVGVTRQAIGRSSSAFQSNSVPSGESLGQVLVHSFRHSMDRIQYERPLLGAWLAAEAGA